PAKPPRCNAAVRSDQCRGPRPNRSPCNAAPRTPRGSWSPARRSPSAVNTSTAPSPCTCPTRPSRSTCLAPMTSPSDGPPPSPCVASKDSGHGPLNPQLPSPHVAHHLTDTRRTSGVGPHDQQALVGFRDMVDEPVPVELTRFGGHPRLGCEPRG